jgi:hypothetical protein
MVFRRVDEIQRGLSLPDLLSGRRVFETASRRASCVPLVGYSQQQSDLMEVCRRMVRGMQSRIGTGMTEATAIQWRGDELKTAVVATPNDIVAFCVRCILDTALKYISVRDVIEVCLRQHKVHYELEITYVGIPPAEPGIDIFGRGTRTLQHVRELGRQQGYPIAGLAHAHQLLEAFGCGAAVSFLPRYSGRPLTRTCFTLRFPRPDA